MVSKIVCGTDFTDCATRAGRAAAALARQLGARLEIVHVAGGDEGDEPWVDRRQAVLDGQVARLRDAWPEVAIEGHLGAGYVEDVIAERARLAGSLVVLGSHGRRRPARWLVGSNAERVAQVSAAPVLVVRNPAPFEASARGGAPLSVMIALDFSRTSRAALAWAGELRRALGTSLTAIHVASPIWEAIRLGLRGAPEDRLTSEAEEVLRRDLSRFVRETLSGEDLPLQLLARRETVEAQLGEAASDHGLLVVGTHQRAAVPRVWYGSVSRGALALADTNVALVPVSAVRLPPEPVRGPRRVLVPVDFSAASPRAVAYACALTPDGGIIHLLHVVRPIDHPEEPEEVLRARLEAMVPPSARERGIVVTAEVLPAREVPDGIWHVAERIGAELVCMPSRDEVRSLSATGPGSTARAVCARSACPVVLTPPERPE